MWKDGVRDESFKLFNFISPTISMWARCVLHDMPSSISNCTLEDLHGGKPIKYGSMVYVYGWMMKDHQPIGIDYQPIRDDNYIEDPMTQHYMDFGEDPRGKVRFWSHPFP